MADCLHALVLRSCSHWRVALLCAWYFHGAMSQALGNCTRSLYTALLTLPGEEFEAVKARTSTFPFQAIWQGRQQLPADYWREFLRAPYLFLLPFCIGAYLSHPLMQRGALWLGW